MGAVKRWFNKFLAVVFGLMLLSMPFASHASAIRVPIGGGYVSATQILSNYSGAYNTIDSPPSPVIAVNSQRVVQLVNEEYEITNRSGKGVTGTAHALTHTAPYIYLSDPQVMWDPSSNRFYYSFLENDYVNGVNNDGISWGFSKTASPNVAADFCSYFNDFNYGSTSFPDRQFMGDTSNFIVWGSDRIPLAGANGPTGSDAAWVTKPGAGSVCPSASSFQSGVQSLSNASPTGMQVQQPITYPYYPVVARQTDSSPTGWIVGLPSFVSANYLTLIQISRGSNGLPVFGTPTNVLVPQYSCPDIVPQKGSSLNGESAPKLEANISLDGMTMGYDPRVGHEALWTTDTIAESNPVLPVSCNTPGNNYGAAVRWYEINPAVGVIDQVGTIGSPSMDYFNSAIAPDRAVMSGQPSKYGSDMAITFNSSSSNSDPAIWYEGKEGAYAASAPILIKQSTKPYEDFSCYEPGYNSCRFGDWPGAAPDPLNALIKGQYGQVWLSNEWNVPQTLANNEDPTWRTEIAHVGFY